MSEENKVISVITLEDLLKQLKEVEKLKNTIENDYYQVLGQISLLKQQIDILNKRQPKSDGSPA